MEYIKEININEAVIHILDNNNEEPILNQFRLSLDEEIYKFILKHLDKCLKDENLQYAKFKEESIVKNISQGYLNGQSDFIEVSKELAKQLFILMKGNESITSCDLMIVSISTEYGPMLVILKMDYVKNYIHEVDVIEDRIKIKIYPEVQSLPVSSTKIQKCAFIKPIREDQDFNLMVIDKQSKSKNEEYGSNYFINKYLGCTRVENERDNTKKFIKATDKWIKTNLGENAELSEKVIRNVNKALKEKDTINVEELSQDIFGDSEVKFSYSEFIEEEGIKEKVIIDKDYVDKKFRKRKLKLDNNIEICMDEKTYNDTDKFEIKKAGDGSINIVIKNIYNYIQK